MVSFSVLFYRLLIDPLLNGLRHSIKEQVAEGSSCLDIACGTGTLVFELGRGCTSVTGIDLDEPKINAARERAEIKGLDHLSFRLMDATDLSEFSDQQFDYVTMAMAIHQFPPDLREPIIREAKRVSNKLIIADYAVPMPNCPSGWLAKFIELLAGKEHNGNFRNYYKSGGLENQLKMMNLSFKKRATRGVGVFSVWECKN
ncbi:MAG: class I SAM-dependent methyltransferase [Bacteroidales bacterium]|nr:class I SAM-dependent methyltransferase [Bacteroidales bacterium]